MKRILLVEDDPFLIDIYTTKIKEFGFMIDIVQDGDDALRKIKEEPPDLVLLDIVLPTVNGWEILKEIRRSNHLKNLKVIILSNLGEKREVERGLKSGADKYLIKAQYTPSEVVEEIKNLLE